MHLPLAIVLLALPSTDANIYSFASSAPSDPESQEEIYIHLPPRHLLGGRLYDIMKTSQQEYIVLLEL
jgi:hypothetical protein